MPIAHTCASCGNDLTRIRAPLDPHYRLPVVVCPECKFASVRRSDGARCIPRDLRLRMHATRRLIEATALLLIFSAGLVGLCFGLQSTLEVFRLPFFEAIQGLFSAELEGRAWQWRNDVGLVVFVIWLVMSLAAGAYLTAAARHRSRLRLLAVWLVPVVLTLLVPAAIMVAFTAASSVRSPPRFCPPEARWAIVHFPQVLAGAAVVMAAGIPLGIIARTRFDRFTARRFRRLRKRLVARRLRA